MTSQLFSSMNRFEAGIIADSTQDLDRKPTSLEIFEQLLALIKGDIDKGLLAPRLVNYTRFAIKLNPYSPRVPALITIHSQTVKTIAQQKMPGLFDILNACRDKGLAPPLIISCEKYMPAALALQREFGARYASVSPIIVRGDLSLNEPRYEAPVLSLPVADSYEALPVKVFEAYVFLQALGVPCGIVKIDDDLKPAPGFTLDTAMLAAMFAHADYQGVPVQNVAIDRLWHHGKCAEPTPAVYGKPLKSVWARGALYFLSSYALEKLAQHYMRFPGCLDGECYEDKAVGDVLFDNGVVLMPCVLEQALGLDSREQKDRA